MVRYRETVDAPIVQIPASELTPGMVHVETPDGQQAWMPQSALEPGNREVFHPPLEGRVKELVDGAYDALADVWGTKAPGREKLVDNFRTDLNAWQEIYQFVKSSRVIGLLVKGRETADLVRRRELYQVCVACMSEANADAVMVTAGVQRVIADDTIRDTYVQWNDGSRYILVSREEKIILLEYAWERYESLKQSLDQDQARLLVEPPARSLIGDA
jgi:hypothetical protein